MNGRRWTNLKLLYVTDIHESKGALNWLLKFAGDSYYAIVVGGDITTEARMPFLEEFLDSVRKIRGKIFLVQGNHEPREMAVPTSMNLLHGRKLVLGEFTIGGLGGSNFTSVGAPFEYGDEEARSLLDALGPVDVLVSHCPPYGTRCDLAPDGKNYGSVPVREYVESRKPRLVLCGHVHVARAVDKLGETTIVNPGPLNEGNYAVVDVLKNKFNVELGQETTTGPIKLQEG
jgi:uncharacterized protein